MRVVVHSVAIQNCDGAALIIHKIRRRFPWLELIWADGCYNACCEPNKTTAGKCTMTKVGNRMVRCISRDLV